MYAEVLESHMMLARRDWWIEGGATTSSSSSSGITSQSGGGEDQTRGKGYHTIITFPKTRTYNPQTHT